MSVDSGRQPPTSETGRCLNGVVSEDHSLRIPGASTRGDHDRVARLGGPTAVECDDVVAGVDERCTEFVGETTTTRRIETLIEWKERVTTIEDTTYGVDEFRSGRHVDRHQVRHESTLRVSIRPGSSIVISRHRIDDEYSHDVNRWIVGARPRTLPAAAVPVGLGAVVAVGETQASWASVPMAAVVALALQVGVNYANDYSDGVRGTDDDRVGPLRLVASGLATPSAVKRAALAAFAVAALAGLILAASTTWWLVVVGAASISAGWFYTGGPKPYGYAGFGELFVFVFFGLVATVGTTYVVLERLPSETWWLGASTGALSCALLVTNNLRDVPTDKMVGKNTLAVRLGVERTRRFFVFLIAASFGSLIVASLSRPEFLFGLFALPLGASPIRSVVAGATGPRLIPVLVGTGRLQLAVGALVVAAGIVLG